MSDIADRLRTIIQRIEDQAGNIVTEEGTKQVLIVPFINSVLGFDTSDVREVRPEFTADVGTKKGERVDYAIMVGAEPVILVEAKKVGTALDAEQPNQLLRYFNAVKSAKFGIYTNGVRYLFYSDLASPNVMDQLPFLELDLSEALDPVKINEIKRFTKPEFNAEHILASANRLKYTNALKSELAREFSAPSEELARLLMGRVFDGQRTSRRVKEFQEYAAVAASQYTADLVRNKLTAALARNEGVAQEEAPNDPPEESEDDGIVTTEDELAAFYITKAIVHGVIEPERVTLRDQKTVCLILLGDSRRQWIVRLYFNNSRYRLGLRDDEGQERRVELESLNEMYNYADDIRQGVRQLL